MRVSIWKDKKQRHRRQWKATDRIRFPPEIAVGSGYGGTLSVIRTRWEREAPLGKILSYVSHLAEGGLSGLEGEYLGDLHHRCEHK